MVHHVDNGAQFAVQAIRKFKIMLIIWSVSWGDNIYIIDLKLAIYIYIYCDVDFCNDVHGLLTESY